MPITAKDIQEHRDHFGLDDISDMDIEAYKRLLEGHTFFWITHNEIVRHVFSGEPVAATSEQIDALIEHFQQFKEKMLAAGK